MFVVVVSLAIVAALVGVASRVASIFFLIKKIEFCGIKNWHLDLVQAQHVAELVQRAQQLVPNVQQVGAQRCGHAPQVPLVVLYAPLQCGQRVVRVHVQTG